MQIHNYDPQTGEYKGPGQADPDPKNARRFLIPAHATSAIPPAPEPHQAPAFIDGAWVLVSDFRGTRWFRPDGTNYEITELDVAPGPSDSDHDPRPSIHHVLSGSSYVLNREAWLNAEVRPRRNALLTDSDHYMLPDLYEAMTPTAQTAWKDYRQALRDLPSSIDFDNPVWPEPPV